MNLFAFVIRSLSWHRLSARVMSALAPSRLATLPLFACALLLAACDSKAPAPAETSPQPAAQTLPAASAPSAPAHTTPTQQTTPPTSSSPDDRAGWPKVVRVGLVPVEGGSDTKARWAPLGEALEKHLGVPVELISASTYQGVITAMGNDQLEFAYMGPKSYVEAANRAKGEALLVELNLKGEPGYRCIFVVPAASPIKDLKDAKGLKFAFTDINSTSGYLIPAMTLLDVLGQPADKFFGQVTFSGSHSTSLLEIASNKIDVAATNDLDTNYAVAQGTIKAEAFRVIYTSELIPGSPMVCRKDIPASLKRAFVDAILEMSKDTSILDKLKNGGFRPITDQQFDVIRASQKFLESQSTTPKPAGG